MKPRPNRIVIIAREVKLAINPINKVVIIHESIKNISL
jgi:hypothetical protein